MFTATIAEMLHAKDPEQFGQLIARLIEKGLISPASARTNRD